MESGIVFLVLAGVLIGLLIISLIIWAAVEKNSCFPFKRGGFGPDNGYDQPRIETIKKKGKNK